MEESKDLGEKQKRSFALGMRAGIFGLIANALLFAAKLAVGILVHSIAVVADACNNLSDGASSAVTVAGYKVASRPADREHPFGHARFEYVAALIVSVVMFVIGALFLKESIEAIFAKKQPAERKAYLYIVLGIAVLVKGAMAAVYGISYRKTASLPMKAAATDSLGDMLVTSAAILSAILRDVTGANTDGYFGAAISAFILFTAVRLMKDSVSPLLGTAPLESLVDDLKKKVLSYAGVLGVHDVTVHSYGAGQVYAVMHIEVSAERSLTDAHALVDRIERDVLSELGVCLVAHVDPLEQAQSAEKRKETVTALLSAAFPEVAIHDFRQSEDEGGVTVYFDAEVPYEEDLTAERIAEKLREADPSANYVVTVDKR